ncbi:MAG: hypothetical protein JNM56_34080 [Planctomycetia bacterium]|nr:hypothetical protein [Planctomycetia bacterium]
MTKPLAEVQMLRVADQGRFSGPALLETLPASMDRAAPPRRVLLISYTFPPVGGAGVQRVAKFVKYLPQHGWLPSVLTVANPSVPLQDDSLLADIPSETVIRKARTWEPGYALKSAVTAGESGAAGQSSWKDWLKRAGRAVAGTLLQPDPQVLWLPGALRAGQRLLNEFPHSAILASGPPFSTFLTAALLSRWSGLPLILDYRDEWSLSNAYLENKQLGRCLSYFQDRLQRSVVAAAEVLLATTRASAAALEDVAARANRRPRVAWVYNGFDPEDFAGDWQEPAPAADYRLAYVGTLWKLTSALPLVQAVELLAQRQPELCARLEITVAGRCVPAQQEVLARLKLLPCRLVELPYLEHRQAVEVMRGARALCVLLADVPGAERVMPAKLFEYLATQRSILAIAPRGELWDVLGDHPRAGKFEPRDIEGIAGWLASEIERAGQRTNAEVARWDAGDYSRPRQARQLATLLDSVATV